jgi:hypothetical protein
MKIVINTCYGGFGVSHKAMMRYAEIKGITLYPIVSKLSQQGKTTWEPYRDGMRTSYLSYLTEPLKDDGTFEEDVYWSKYPDRTDPDLIQIIEELGEEANGLYAELKIIEIPDGVDYIIEEYDGVEWIAEKHHTWS